MIEKHTGYFGPCKGTPLSEEEIKSLSVGDRVEVVWFGGNGPHIYEVSDRSESYIYRSQQRPPLVSVTKLLEDARFVARAEKP